MPTGTPSPWFTPSMANNSPLRLSTAEVALFGVLGALTFAAKVVMMGLPNIEPVSLMVMLFAVTFGKKAVYPIYVYVLLEFLLYGFHFWSINYLYVWAILAFAAWKLREMTHPLAWALLSAAFGLLFGLLCAPVYLVSGGPAFALNWWISGIPFDLLHGGGNFVLALVLFVPLRRWMGALSARIPRAR